VFCHILQQAIITTAEFVPHFKVFRALQNFFPEASFLSLRLALFEANEMLQKTSRL